MNTSVATALSNLPLPSPASNFEYSISNLNVPVRQSKSGGPILAERAETIGKNRFYVSLTYQRFLFDRQDDLDLHNISTVFPVSLSGMSGLPPTTGVLTAAAFFDLAIEQVTAYFTYGLTDRIDASYAVPVINSTLRVRPSASLSIPGTGSINVPVLAQQWIGASSTGLGDQTFRVKARFLERRRLSLAAVNELRIPVGDEFNYHGAGAAGVKSFLVASSSVKVSPNFGKGNSKPSPRPSFTLAPHLNVGYLWNGSSYLASRDLSEKRRLPGQIFYAAGLDADVSPHLTAAVDVLDQIVIHGQRAFIRSFTENGVGYTSVYTPNVTRHEVSASAGFKARLFRGRPDAKGFVRDLVLVANVQFRLNDTGLRARVVPFFGISYTFGVKEP